MEYARHGNMYNYLQSEERKNLSEEELAVVAGSVLRALKYMHKRGVIHRDVKPANILVTSNGKVKLGDMGTACLSVSNSHSVQGTFQYLAPEIFSVQSYDCKVDIWALGMTLLELAQGFNPFQSEHFARVLFHLVDAPAAPSLEDPSGHSNRFVDFLSKFLTLKPEDRSTAAQLLKHPFLKKAPKTIAMKNRPKSSSVPLNASPSASIESSANSMNSMNSMSSASANGSLRSSCSDDSEEMPVPSSTTTLSLNEKRANSPSRFVVRTDIVHA
jgi:serine/threonine protein kinase